VKARAPGKLVLSGAYAVLEGAPAIVTAVERYVLADAARRAELVTPEVLEAVGAEHAPWFDASELREDGEKLGVGSSAAIVVASLAARALSERGPLVDAELAELVLVPALAAHASAQGGGSGVDVAAAAYGGTLVFHRAEPGAEDAMPGLLRAALPPELVLETWWSGKAASTADFVRRVRALGERDRPSYTALIAAQSEASDRAARALLGAKVAEFIGALGEQRRVLAALGRAAGVDIVTRAVEELAELSAAAAVLPAGAGGGDIVLHVGLGPSPAAFRERATALGHRLLPIALGARGVHAVGDESDAPPHATKRPAP
jgi:phosphomevalonate kinase